MLVVGYDDGQNAWICKNSWGSSWGAGGYVLVGYGEAQIDTYAKAGLAGLNPDPWTKRRMHNGNLYESGNGALHRNLEVLGATGGRVTHHWREGGPPWTWKVAAQFANDAAVCPTLTGTTFNRNMETVYLTTGGRLHHWWVAGGGGTWNDGGVFGPAGCRGVPGFVQGDYGAPGNFEVVVLVAGGRLQHLWRDGAFAWHEGPQFGSNVALSGATLVQGDYYANAHGNLECVAVLNSGQMQHFWRDEPTLTWHAGPAFGNGVGSPPVMIQGQYGMRNEAGPHGNFELCVAVGNRVQHWWRDNSSGSMAWHPGVTFGHDVQAVAGLVEGSWGMNVEVIVLRTDGQLQHYFRDGAGWHEGPVIGVA
jgi:Papain family cysteine protease